MMHQLLLLLCAFALLLPTASRAEEADTVFTCSEIPDSVFARMQGKSFKSNSTISRHELRYLRLSHHDAEGHTRTGEMVCNKLIAQDLVDIFRELWKAGYRIERMQLVDDFDADDIQSMKANNTSCFNFRPVAGTTVLSEHATGMAVDINPLYNPCVRGKKVDPSTGYRWAMHRDKRTDIPYKIDHKDLCYKLFIEHGFRWGGDWRYPRDYQHFQRMK